MRAIVLSLRGSLVWRLRGAHRPQVVHQQVDCKGELGSDEALEEPKDDMWRELPEGDGQ